MDVGNHDVQIIVVVGCPGVTIGDNRVTGAESVVVHGIPANRVAVGNPKLSTGHSLDQNLAR